MSVIGRSCAPQRRGRAQHRVCLSAPDHRALLALPAGANGREDVTRWKPALSPVGAGPTPGSGSGVSWCPTPRTPHHCSHDVQVGSAEGHPPGRRRRWQVVPHEPLRHQQVRLASLPHDRRGVPQQRAGGGRAAGHPADLGHGGSGALPQPPHALLPRLRLLPPHLQSGRRTELPEPLQLEEGVRLLRRRQGPRQLPVCGAGQQAGRPRTPGVRGGSPQVVPGKRRAPVLRNERQGRDERGVGL